MDAPILRIYNDVDNSPWKKILLGDALDLIKDGTHGTHKDVEDGPYLLSAKNIKKGKIVYNESDRKISEIEYNQIYKNYSLKNNDILLTVVGSIGEVAIYQEYATEKIAFQRSVAILRSNQKNNPSFLGYLMQTYKFKKLLNIHKVVSAQPGIYLGDLAKLPIYIPNKLEEQNKISIFFDTLCRKIDLQHEKINLLKEQKKGFVQKIFNGKLRFKGFTDDWKQWRLSELAEIRTGKAFSSLDFNDSGEYLVITNKNIQDEANGYESMGDRINIFDHSVLENYSLGGDNILVTMDGVNIGKVGKFSNDKAVLAQRVGRINSEQFEFIYQILSCDNFINEMNKLAVGNAIKHISLKQISDYSFLAPMGKDEQTEIGTFLSGLDKKIQLNQKKVKLLEEQKKALMQQMFI